MSRVQVLSLPAARYLRPGEKIPDGFITGAAAENIRLHADNAHEQARKWSRLAERLEQLHAERLAQIAAGEWPTPRVAAVSVSAATREEQA